MQKKKALAPGKTPHWGCLLGMTRGACSEERLGQDKCINGERVTRCIYGCCGEWKKEVCCKNPNDLKTEDITFGVTFFAFLIFTFIVCMCFGTRKRKRSTCRDYVRITPQVVGFSAEQDEVTPPPTYTSCLNMEPLQQHDTTQSEVPRTQSDRQSLTSSTAHPPPEPPKYGNSSMSVVVPYQRL